MEQGVGTRRPAPCSTFPHPQHTHSILMSTYKTEFVVVGSGTFPTDMLRHDRCYPNSSEAVNNLETTRVHRKVELASVHEGRVSPVTPERWESFGWKVIRTNTYRI